MFLIFSFDLLLYPTISKTDSLDNAVHWLTHRGIREITTCSSNMGGYFHFGLV